LIQKIYKNKDADEKKKRSNVKAVIKKIKKIGVKQPYCPLEPSSRSKEVCPCSYRSQTKAE